MKPEKIKKWKENREFALDLYRNSNMNVAQIARTLRVSPTILGEILENMQDLSG
jgi:hypothetical protein